LPQLIASTLSLPYNPITLSLHASVGKQYPSLPVLHTDRSWEDDVTCVNHQFRKLITTVCARPRLKTIIRIAECLSTVPQRFLVRTPTDFLGLQTASAHLPPCSTRVLSLIALRSPRIIKPSFNVPAQRSVINPLEKGFGKIRANSWKKSRTIKR